MANLVHSAEAIGNERPVRPSRRENFPLDWSPTTTSYTRDINQHFRDFREEWSSRGAYLEKRDILINSQLSELITDGQNPNTIIIVQVVEPR